MLRANKFESMTVVWFRNILYGAFVPQKGLLSA